ncbi:gamma-parvin isoform X2 [Lagopus leucura]|uniref:gamma-parvin isoform X2 n=1 Tax=Lagopus leucura TaxID=30410 RepID=UPI001C66CA74|nr:gamma-parvin isoform X2 [Lagopus leucura]
MDADFLNAFTQPAALNKFLVENVITPGEKRKLIKPTSSNNPKLEELKLLLIDWINTTLKEEHIVVKSLEEDLYDGLVLHHLLENLGSLKLDVDKIALTEKKQRQKLSVILEAVAKCLQLEESQLKWSVEAILAKDLLSTLHLLVAIAKHFQPSLAFPPNVHVETITFENTSKGLKTANGVEYITGSKENSEEQSTDDAFDELFSRAPERLDDVKKCSFIPLLFSIGVFAVRQPACWKIGIKCERHGISVCRWSYFTSVNWTTRRLFSEFKGFLSDSS